MIKQTVFAISQDQTKPILMGELLEIVDGNISLVAIDGYRLAVRSCKIDNISNNAKVIIPGKTLNDVEVNFIDIEEIKPWDNYRVEFGKRNRCVLSNGSRTPQWWCDYNSVKHARSSFNDGIRNYSKANLFNLSRAFSALYVLEKSLMEFVDKENLSLIEHSHLFEKQEKCVYGVENDCFSIEKKKMI